MWVHEMTDEQKREYGFVDLSIEEMQRLGYDIVPGGWVKSGRNDDFESSNQNIFQRRLRGSKGVV